MYCVACVSRAGKTGAALVTAGFAVALMLAGAAPALAIPSPELIVGSLSSISQLIALVSALLGGGAVVAGVKARGGASGIAAKTALGVIAVLMIALGVLAYFYVSQQTAERSRLEATL